MKQKQTHHEKAVELYLFVFFAAVVGYSLLYATGVFN
jgi:hypothetical protein